MIFMILALSAGSKTSDGVPGGASSVTVHQVSTGKTELFQTQPGTRDSEFGFGAVRLTDMFRNV